MAMRVLVTGVAGFIGSFVAQRLLERGDAVIGLDDLNARYDVRLKEARLARLKGHAAFEFVRGDVCDQAAVAALFQARPARIVHMAAQAGVRTSLDHPHRYVQTNVVGFLNLLEAARTAGTEHLVYASTSAVYGNHAKLPYAVDAAADHPVSMYAATKKSNELMAHAYSHLFAIPTTGLRFFTVYGPWGRPDMALSTFARRMLAGQPIDVFNHGRHTRDFTYIDDAADAVVRILDAPATPDAHWQPTAPNPATSSAPYRIHNVGGGAPVPLMRCIALLEAALGVSATKRLAPPQPGDVPDTAADAATLVDAIGRQPATPIEQGIQRFADWYLAHYGPAPC